MFWVFPCRHVAGPLGWTITVGEPAVLRLGPVETREAAEEQLLPVLGRWQARARAQGGWLWRPEPGVVAVALPATVAQPLGSKSWVAQAVSRASPVAVVEVGPTTHARRRKRR